ncbi:O-antigen export system ATP-binding protein RfbB [Methyloglobulus morosus KoM1]|uniref:O-antigen export system ATP-binding protein RfbB n=1 Tax=Methyloglobulus morosus KoM1 TaxID=1116472 RepID=V5BLA2_9GAMM|nr:ABC transporter ATP-binding protein [Methyloglobulus morosus]ESS74080.1 O-antigen export system ATP-binding protein RfbB [Methyloglobulus morosus KoM1]
MTAIKVENVGKCYVIDHQKQQSRYHYETLGGAVANCGKRAFNYLRHPISSFNNTIVHEDFWALKDINFEINQGDRVGIIGRNGAGKSTLLKILSRITTPTTGQIRIKGRVSSLLEVGTGFHPELTGRENIFLNGAILGMKRQEIKAKFDEIVAFAEVEKFLDTPVKHYSSGMYVRLAFAVAAHLEPEILIVDEVLAVGDAQFQKKCLGKMDEASHDGRTVLFVSHSMGSIVALCNAALFLQNGSISFAGNVNETILKYNQDIQESENQDLSDFKLGRRGHQSFAKFLHISTWDIYGNPQAVFAMGDSVVIKLRCEFFSYISKPIIGVMLRSLTGILIHDFRSSFDGFFMNIEAGVHEFEITVSSIKVYPGNYTLGPWIQSQVGVSSDDYISSAIKISIVDHRKVGYLGSQFEVISKEGSEVYIPCSWRLQ